MHITVSDKVRLCLRLLAVPLLNVVWLIGFGCAVLLYRSSEHVFVSMMRSASCGIVTIVVLLADVILPFSITAYAVYGFKTHLIYPLCFLKALMFGLVVLAVYGAFGSGGWLMQFLLLFTDNISVLLLLAIWIRILSGRAKNVSDVIRLAFFCCGVWGVDLVLVSPFVVSFICM